MSEKFLVYSLLIGFGILWLIVLSYSIWYWYKLTKYDDFIKKYNNYFLNKNKKTKE